MMTGTVYFEQKTTICNAKFGDLGDNGDRRSKYVIESAIFGIADPDLPIHYAISLTRKIVSEMTYNCVEWDVKPYYTIPQLLRGYNDD